MKDLRRKKTSFSVTYFSGTVLADFTPVPTGKRERYAEDPQPGGEKR
jgi:hypothetical protein